MKWGEKKAEQDSYWRKTRQEGIAREMVKKIPPPGDQKSLAHSSDKSLSPISRMSTPC